MLRKMRIEFATPTMMDDNITYAYARRRCLCYAAEAAVDADYARRHA